MFFRRVLELKRWTPHAPVHLFISLSCVAWSSWERSAFHFIPFIRTWSLQSVKRGCNLPLRRCNQASQLKAELICVPLHWLTWRGFFFFCLFHHNMSLKKVCDFSCLYVSVRLCVSGRKHFEFIFGHTGRKRQRNKSQSAQSDRNPILLEEKVTVNTAWCKFSDRISCK